MAIDGEVRTNANDKKGYGIFKLGSARRCHHFGLVARKPAFGVSDKASFKPVSSVTQTS